MKHNRLITPLVICVGLLVLAFAFSGSRLAAKDNNGTCSLKTLNGSYAAQISGWQGTGAARVPIAATGVVVLDGNGGITGSAMFSVDGTIFPQAVNGTYTVDPETCSGDAVSTIGTFHFAIADNGKQTRIVGTSPGTTVVGEAIRQ
jgi:hypothetical protein